MAQLPIVTINGRDYFADLRLREFRATNNPHVRISYYDVLEKPDVYVFNEPIQRGKVIVYTRGANNKLSVAVADFSGRETFGNYPLAVRLQARAGLLMASTFDEQEKIAASGALPEPYRRLVWDDLLCKRADDIRARNVKYDEDVAEQRRVLSTPTTVEKKVLGFFQQDRDADDDVR